MAGVGRKPNTSLPSGPDADDRAYAAMVARAKALIPQLPRSCVPDRRVAAAAAGDRTRFA